MVLIIKIPVIIEYSFWFLLAVRFSLSLLLFKDPLSCLCWSITELVLRRERPGPGGAAVGRRRGGDEEEEDKAGLYRTGTRDRSTMQ